MIMNVPEYYKLHSQKQLDLFLMAHEERSLFFLRNSASRE